ncbi:MAG: urea ABC transporter substrate-binding protein [gamma proteobacterium symbiont of Taylorina sp.]|nr:urea ABC transporter substrate-binding protein [gamma proteobacterium symbiont of Taylorina sp.]
MKPSSADNKAIERRGLMVLLAVLMMAFMFGWFMLKAPMSFKDPIKVGILHSLSGTMAISERSVADATLLAIEQINASGGLLGRQIEPIIVDGQSDWSVFAREAERLITKEKVAVIFGCWTSACRKTIKPIIEAHNHLLFYPLQYEGLEISKHIIYTGANPSQQIIPGLHWLIEKFGNTLFLVGSDTIFPRAANAIINDYAKALGAEVLGEAYRPLGSDQFDAIVEQIIASKSDMILNTINGESNIAFFKALHKAGIRAEQIPVISYSVTEQEVMQIGVQNMQGHYAAWNYFQSIDSDENKAFINAFRQRFGRDQILSDPMESAYIAVNLWANAVNNVGNITITDVLSATLSESYRAPQGMVYIASHNRHVWKKSRLGRVQGDGSFKMVWQSDKRVTPIIYPPSRTKNQWEHLLQSFYNGWDEQWAKSLLNAQGER